MNESQHPKPTDGARADAALPGIVGRARTVAQSKAEFPLLEQRLAELIVIEAQSSEMSCLAIQRQIDQAALIPSEVATRKIQIEAENAVVRTALTFEYAEALLTLAALDEFPKVLGFLNSITGGDPSTEAAASAALNYRSYLAASGVINVFRARYGNLPRVVAAMRQLDAKFAAVSSAYEAQILDQINEYHATIASATSTSDLRDLSRDPQFQFAVHRPQWRTGLRSAYNGRWAQLQEQSPPCRVEETPTPAPSPDGE